MGSRRLFVGIFPPPEVARTVHGAVAGSLEGARVRRIPAEEIHLTLQFLGATDEAAIADLAGALARTIPPLRQPRLTIQGAGGFPDSSGARVLWVGAPDQPGTEGRLAAIARAARVAAIEAGLAVAEAAEAEEPWRAHLTVARSSRGRLRLPEAFADLRLAVPWAPEEVHLVESCPGARGAERFPVLAAFRLIPDSA